MIGLDLASPGTDAPRLKVAPMLSVSALVSILDRNYDQIIKLISSGKLAFAFDVGIGQKREETRVLPAAVICYCAGVPCRLVWEEIATSLVPETATAKPGVVVTLTSLEVQRILNVTQTHVESLLECRQLKRLTEARRGPGGSCKVSADSFLKFLHRRKL